MKIGVFAVLFGNKPFEETLDYLVELGVEAIEIGTGAYPGNAHCDPAALLRSDRKLEAFRQAISRRGLTISALSCHGNPLHPQTRLARDHHDVFIRTLELARRLEVETVITFSGCPAGDPKGAQPNWIVSPWPPEFAQMLAWQWKERVRPYWREAARACRAAGVRVAIEMHPNFVAYNPETMLQLRDIAPRVIGCNFDPSHMFWQGVDVVTAIRTLGDAIYHVHAKDCRVDRANVAKNGVLDTKKYTRELERSWIFRTVGYGNDALVWKDIVSTLRLVGYDHVLSIEHEDSVMSGAEGLKKAIAFLKDVVVRDPAGEAYWA
ncbi:MAG: sugar phosphate isomerase/epimerase [Acidobacteria bacterium]|nr:sugar phosphate isomerase/epimerase [Acidobacteriota bacterium]MCA1649821.1 sugar phosphate isomerase/epimerase [Acidobacteriota bacterium]